MKKLIYFLLLFPIILSAQEEDDYKYLALYLNGHIIFPGFEIGMQSYVNEKIDMITSFKYDNLKMASMERNHLLMKQQVIYYKNPDKRGIFLAPQINIGTVDFFNNHNPIPPYQFFTFAFGTGMDLGFTWSLSRYAKMMISGGLGIRYLKYNSYFEYTSFDSDFLNDQPLMINKHLEIVPSIQISFSYSTAFNNK